MMTEQMTFNDLPKAVSQLLEKISDLELCICKLRDDIKDGSSRTSEHIPMNLNEACEFLKMKKATMYYHLQHRSIPATRKGAYSGLYPFTDSSDIRSLDCQYFFNYS